MHTNMKNALLLLTMFPALAMCQINPSIPLMFNPVQIQNPMIQYQQIQQIRANQAIADQIQEQRAADEQRRRNQEAAARRNSANEADLAAAWREKAMKRSYLYPDFEQVVFAEDVTFTIDMIRVMAVSDYAADIAYYFGKNKIEAMAVANMPMVEAAKSIASIEKKFK